MCLALCSTKKQPTKLSKVQTPGGLRQKKHTDREIVLCIENHTFVDLVSNNEQNQGKEEEARCQKRQPPAMRKTQ